MTLVSDPSAPRIAIIGATGAVGGTLVELFEERKLPYRELYLVASPRSAGREVCVAGRYYTVRDLEEFDFTSVDLAFFSAGTAVSERWVPVATAAGALVIDNTRAFRMDPATPWWSRRSTPRNWTGGRTAVRSPTRTAPPSRWCGCSTPSAGAGGCAGSW